MGAWYKQASNLTPKFEQQAFINTSTTLYCLWRRGIHVTVYIDL